MITVSTVANASEKQLLCITYELFLEKINFAIEVEGKERTNAIKSVREVLLVLTENLNMEIPLAQDLFKLYVYVQNILINEYKKDEKLKEAHNLITLIYKAYKTLEEQDALDGTKNTPIMENAQSVYAGMTYGKGYLNEITMDEPSRGFKA